MNAPVSAPTISLEEVSFSFSGQVIFSSLNFEIEAGQWTCILGPSGCGKTTLLRLISGSFDDGISGTIRFDGKAPRSGTTALMAQKDLLLPWLTVTENVLLGARLRGEVSHERREKALDLIDRAGLDGYAGAYPFSLSGGMRQRVALLRTLMEERPVILMDEPFSALDALTRMKLQDLASSMVEGATVVLVTHDPFEALRLGHRIHILAGSPARTGEALVPDTPPPRGAGDPGIDRLHAELIKRLNQEA
jgi:putative hydroxymethylpyrimidine transport system ATP-binding protein